MRSGAAAAIASFLLLSGPLPVTAQVAPPNAAGVAMGHLHYHVPDVGASRAFWTALGGRATASGRDVVVVFPDVLVLLTPGEASGGSDGSVVNHVAFRVPSFAAVEAAGLKVQRLAQFPGVGSVTSPDGERVELFEDAATNLTFTQDSGYADRVAERHNAPVGRPIAFHHIHLYVPEGAVAAAKAWYTKTFGGTPGRRSQYEAVDLPGVNINISAAPRPATGTRGRRLDHIGFEVTALEALCRRLAAEGIRFDEPYARDDGQVGRAVMTDPWGTRIELTEGLRTMAAGPRTPWGDPDLQGTYTNTYENGTLLERPDQSAGRRLEDVKGEDDNPVPHYECHEGNCGLRKILSAARAGERGH
jgi:catechol 2,3-dioxygenase-like lactoylglutathione lyase family enzyme